MDYKRLRHFVHRAYDPPLTLHDGDRLFGSHVLLGGTMLGRVLFTEPTESAVLVAGSGVVVRNCHIRAC